MHDPKILHLFFEDIAPCASLVTSFRNAHAPQVMIHGSKPISATIGNYNAVYRVLKGTPHEWMLERHLEPKSSR